MENNVGRAMAPTDDEISTLRLSSHIEIASELLGERGFNVLDVGCGDGKFTRALVNLFKEVSGIDVKVKPIDEAKMAAASANVVVDFRVDSGEDMPFLDKSFDVVVFSNSLHHMPHPDKALREAQRVLKPDGKLYVMEPVPSGNYHEATKLVNDETVVRTQAYQELIRLSSTGFAPLREVMYRAQREILDFEDWRRDQIERDPKREALFDLETEEVRRRFESKAARRNGRFVFEQVFRVNVLQKVSDK